MEYKKGKQDMKNGNMKQLTHLKSPVTHVRWILCGILLAGGLVIGPTSQIASGHANPNPGVIPPHARAYGLSYAEWGAQCWRWAYSFPLASFRPCNPEKLVVVPASPALSGFFPGPAGKGQSSGSAPSQPAKPRSFRS